MATHEGAGDNFLQLPIITKSGTLETPFGHWQGRHRHKTDLSIFYLQPQFRFT